MKVILIILMLGMLGLSGEVLDMGALKQVGKKKAGLSAGGLYEDESGVQWYVKTGQDAFNEYFAAQLMRKYMGDVMPEVRMVKGSIKQTGSRVIDGFKPERLVTIDGKDVIGGAKLTVLMDLFGIGARSHENMGFIEKGGKLYATRVDFDHAFEFEDYTIGRDYIKHLVYRHRLEEVREALDVVSGITRYSFAQYTDEVMQEMKSHGYSGVEARVAKLTRYIFDRLKAMNVLWGNLKDEERLSLEFLSAVVHGDLGKVKKMREGGFKVKGEEGEMFVEAAYGGHLEMMDYWLREGVVLDDVAERALSNAVRGGSIESVEYLLAKGVDVTSKGSTALSLAAMNSDEEVLRVLLEAGGNPYVFSVYDMDLYDAEVLRIIVEYRQKLGMMDSVEKWVKALW